MFDLLLITNFLTSDSVIYKCDTRDLSKICATSMSRVTHQQYVNLSWKMRDGSLKGLFCTAPKSIRSMFFFFYVYSFDLFLVNIFPLIVIMNSQRCEEEQRKLQRECFYRRARGSSGQILECDEKKFWGTCSEVLLEVITTPSFLLYFSNHKWCS